MTPNTFGGFIRERRLALDMSLRAFCQRYSEDPSNWSKMERGVLRPPSSLTRILEIAERLELAEREKQTLFDLARAGAGRIPEDIMSEKGLVAQLPMVFRSLRGDAPSEEELMRLADLIRDARTPANDEAI